MRFSLPFPDCSGTINIHLQPPFVLPEIRITDIVFVQGGSTSVRAYNDTVLAVRTGIDDKKNFLAATKVWTIVDVESTNNICPYTAT